MVSNSTNTNPHPYASASGASSPPAPGGVTEEPYSFFSLATAEFPSDWKDPTVKVRYR